MKDVYRKFMNLYSASQSGSIKKDERRFDKACKEFKKAELLLKPTASLLVKKGISIQLSSEACPYPLKEAEKAFKEAIKEDADCLEAHIELANYYLNVQNKPKAAKKHFEKALEIGKSNVCQAISGIALCIKEIQSQKAALKYLKDNNIFILGNFFQDTMEEIKSM